MWPTLPRQRHIEKFAWHKIVRLLARRPKADSRETVWRSFAHGLVRPSWPAFLGTIIVALVTLLGINLLVHPRMMAKIDVGYFQIDSRDEFGYATARAIQLHYLDSPRDVVVVCGASTIRDALLEEQNVSDILEEQLGREVPVHILSGPGMSIWNQRDLAACLSGRVRGVIVLNVAPGMLTNAETTLLKREHRLGLERVAYEEHTLGAARTAQSNERLSDIFVQRNYWSDRWKRLLFRAPVGPVDGLIWRPDRRVPWTKEIWDKRFPKALAGKEESLREFHNDPHRFDVLRRCIDDLKRDGNVEIVLLESTSHPQMRDELGDAFAEYGKCMRRFAESNGVHYWDLHAAAELTPDDFDDTQHIGHRNAARRITAVFARRVAELLFEKERL